jgi:hypothetical protein
MTFVNVAVMVAVLGLAMGASMLYYGTRGKKRMRQGMDDVAGVVSGTVTQPSRMHYPRLEAQVDGRPVEVFVHLSEGHRKTSDFVYLVLSTPADLAAGTLVFQEGYFAVAPDRAGFNDVAGDYLEGRLPGRYVYAADEALADRLLADAKVRERIAAFERYPGIVLGPDAITVGKPYGGARDLLPEQIVPDLKNLVALAADLGTRAGKAPAAAKA